jgi:phage FluMu protein gp41
MIEPARNSWLPLQGNLSRGRGKRTPHHDLARIQAQVASLGAAAFTKTALDGGREMGYHC